MALLTIEEQQRYALAHGKVFIACCDKCGVLVPVGKLYVVKKWQPRKGGLMFLGQTPLKLWCMSCDNKAHPKRKEFQEKHKEQKVTGNRFIRRCVIRLFEKNKKLKLQTKMLISRLKRRKKLLKVKHREFTKVFKALKKEKILQYKERQWMLRPKKKSAR